MSLQSRQKESKGEKTLNYVRNPEELEQFYQDISSFNEEVAKVKDFKDKMIVYNCGEKLMQTSLYFKRISGKNSMMLSKWLIRPIWSREKHSRDFKIRKG